MSRLLAEIEQRWQAQFTALAAGEDLSPGARLRLEGLMEAAVLCDIASREQLQSGMSHKHQAAFGVTLEEAFGEDWTAFYPFPQIPAVMRRAPVVPTAPQ